MDFFLKYNESDTLRLPVPPPDFTIQQGNLNQSVTVTDIGELNLWGPEKLAGVTIESFIPYEYNPTFCSYIGFPKPWDCIEKINKWRVSGKPVRLIITDSNKDVDINMEVLIESIDSKMQDFTGDVYFILVLKQYKKTTVPQQAGAITVKESKRPAPPSSEKKAGGQRIHTVISGDTLWTLAKRYYGNGSKYPKIAAANPKIKDPNLIYSGSKLIIP